MTHRKKLTIFLLAVATLFTFVFLIHPYRKNDSSLLSDKLLRFRVLADSDSSIDQYEKNELSKKMITLLSLFKCLLQLCAVRLWRTKLRLLYTRFPSLSL